MGEGRSKALLALSWLWIAAVAGYMAWGVIYEAGLSRWLSAWQLDQWGAYYPEQTAFVAGFLIAAPAFWYIRRRAAIVRAREGSGPSAEARRMARTARNCALAGLVAALVGGGAFLLSQRVPDGTEKAALYDGARLGTEPAPAGKVRIAGRLEPEARTYVTETGGVRERVVHYVGFRPDGVARDAPPSCSSSATSWPRRAAHGPVFLPERRLPDRKWRAAAGAGPAREAGRAGGAPALSAEDRRPRQARALLHHSRRRGPAGSGLPRRGGNRRHPGAGPAAVRRSAGGSATGTGIGRLAPRGRRQTAPAKRSARQQARSASARGDAR